MEPENVPFMSICILYADSKYMYCSLNGEYETALYRQWFVLILYRCALYTKYTWMYQINIKPNI